MLYISLALSGVLLVAAFLAARYSRYPTGTTIGCAAVVAWLPLYFWVALPAVWYQCALLVVGLQIAWAVGRSRRAVRPVAVGSFLIAYAILGASLVGREREYARLRAEYPFESMEDRLPRPVPPSAPGDPDRLARWEGEIDAHSHNRRQFLATLHEDTTRRFVERRTSAGSSGRSAPRVSASTATAATAGHSSGRSPTASGRPGRGERLQQPDHPVVVRHLH